MNHRRPFTSDESVAQLHTLCAEERYRELDDDALVAAVQETERLGRIVDTLRVQLAGEVGARTSSVKQADPELSLAHRFGFPSARALLQQLTLASGRTVSGRLKLAQLTNTRSSLTGAELPPQFASVGGAMARGDLHIDTAQLITNALGSLPPHVDPQHRDFAEQSLVASATGAPHPGDEAANDAPPSIPHHTDTVRTLTFGWLAALDQEGTEPDEATEERRFFSFGELRDGLIPVRGALLPEAAAMLGRLFDAINSPRSGVTTPEPGVRFREVSATQPEEIRDPRSANQKRHDALTLVFQTAMKQADTPTLGGERISLVVEATEAQLAHEHGVAWVTDPHGTNLPVHASVARHAACAGTTHRVTRDPRGRIISIEYEGRVFNSHQRKAIMLRDGGCIIPGCHTPATWCEIHHVQPHSEGGPTHTDNGVLLCWSHHRNIERSGWSIRMVDGLPQVQAPKWLDPSACWHTPRPPTSIPNLPPGRRQPA